MFERISNSFSLAKSSWHVLIQDKKLVLFPVISGLACLLVVILFFVPTLLIAHTLGLLDQNNQNAPTWWLLPVGFAFYFCTWFVIIFCNAALISCALMRFSGEQPTLGEGFRAAASRLPQIAVWALVSATVSVLLKAVENANEKVGAFISGLLGTAWSIMTYFVVPVLVVEKVGPFNAVSRSLAILKKTWGEALVGHFGLGFFMLLLALPGIVLGVLAVLCFTGKLVPVGIALLVLTGLYFLAHAAVGSALNTIYLSALYQYAAFNTIPNGFEARTIQGAFQPKAAA
jgi:hypothetical protein